MAKKPTYEQLEQRAKELEKECLERRRAEEALRESEEKYRSLVKDSIDGIAIVQGLEMRFVNRALLKMFGFHSEGEMVGHTFTDFVSPEQRRVVVERGLDREEGKPVVSRYEFKALRKNGTEFDAELSVSRITYQGGAARQGIIRDISERKQAEEALQRAHEELERRVEERTEELTKANKELKAEIIERKRAEGALRKSEERLRGFMDSATDSFSLYDSALNFVEINEAAMKFFPPGTEKEDVIGTNVLEWAPNLKPTGRYDKYVEVIKTGEPFFADDIAIDPRLGEKHVSVRAFTVGDGLGIVCTDLTERVQAEEALRDSGEKYRSLVESTEDSVYLVDRDCRYLFMNEKHLSRFDLPADKVIGRAYRKFHPKKETKQFAEKVKEVFETDKSLWYEYRSQRDSGYFLRTLSPVKEPDGRTTAVTVVSKDITGLKRTEKALREREKELEIKTSSLEEVNTALRVLLKRRDEDREDLEENVLVNVKELVLPFLEKVKKTPLDPGQRVYIGVLESNLNDIISPFLRTLPAKYVSLTPTEIQVANLIKQGTINKEVARLMNLSIRTVEFHRENIRRKLGIRNKKTNLRTHLLSIQ